MMPANSQWYGGSALDVLYIQLGHMTIVIILLYAHLLLECYCEVLQEDASSSTAVLIISLVVTSCCTCVIKHQAIECWEYKM